MAQKYERGQRVRITAVKSQHSSSRDSLLESYAGQSGTVTDYYLLSRGTEVFCIYIVRIGNNKEEVVLHEDELESFISE
jgi:ribosomal protein L21E